MICSIAPEHSQPSCVSMCVCSLDEQKNVFVAVIAKKETLGKVSIFDYSSSTHIVIIVIIIIIIFIIFS